MIVSVIQIQSTNNVNKNLEKVRVLLESSLNSNPHVIVFPEYLNYMGPLENLNNNTIDLNNNFHEILSNFARNNNIDIIAGLLEKGSGTKRISTAIHFNTNGDLQTKYNKIHLFNLILEGKPIIDESHYLSAGNKVVLFNVRDIKSGLAICYDLRFPELFRQLSHKGAKVFFLPSAFTETTGKAHWEILLRARAIENQVFIVAPNQVGFYMKDKCSYGNSMIIDPWGEILVRAPSANSPDAECVITAELDFVKQKKIRTNLPCLQHRRKDIFIYE